MVDGETDGGRGLTPVVGIVLLVAITLLLASAVAAFAFGLEDDSRPDRVPTAALTMEYDEQPVGDDTLRIVHQRGQTVATERVAIAVDGAACAGGGTPDGRDDAATWHAGGLAAGQAIAIDGSTAVCTGGDLDVSGATGRVVWVSDAGTSTQLQSWTGPD